MLKNKIQSPLLPHRRLQSTRPQDSSDEEMIASEDELGASIAPPNGSLAMVNGTECGRSNATPAGHSRYDKCYRMGLRLRFETDSFTRDSLYPCSARAFRCFVFLLSALQFGRVSELQKFGNLSKGSHSTKVKTKETLETVSFQERKWQRQKC